MMFKHTSTIIKAGLFAALFVVGTQATASAAPIVNFSTTGVFGISGTNVATFTGGGGTATLTFSGTTNSVDAPSNVNYGDFLFSTTGNFTGSANTSFTLNLAQTAPVPGTSSLSSTLTGTFARLNATDFFLQFSTPSTTIDGVTYFIQQQYFIVPPSSGVGGGAMPGDTTIQGRLTATAVPEPATMMLLGTGLLAAFRARRRNA